VECSKSGTNSEVYIRMPAWKKKKKASKISDKSPNDISQGLRKTTTKPKITRNNKNKVK
jgi:hypothetical protein